MCDAWEVAKKLRWESLREAAIVSATPGTTRDPVEVSLDLAGHKVRPRIFLPSAALSTLLSQTRRIFRFKFCS